MRVQLALNVPDLAQAVAYYSKLFGVPPHKQRPGYANFAIDRPALKLVLFENPGADGHLNHVGVEVFEPADLAGAVQRLSAAGLVQRDEEGSVCCHATQDKVWSTAPGGLNWEWYRITDDAPAEPTAPHCCAS